MSAWMGLFVPDPIMHALADEQFNSPTPIQQQTLILAIRDYMYQDIIGAAETGSGKTFAFGIPVPNHILKIQEKKQRQKMKKPETLDGSVEDDKDDEEEYNKLLSLILTPTRELAIQVKNHLVKVAKYAGIH